MTTLEKWKRYFADVDNRFRERTGTIPTDGRNPFENDYGRLISSAPIRRLQDKTQVFPLGESDFTRTRLTHSLEVSYIGSSIGQSIEKLLIEKGEIEEKHKGYLSSLLRVAGLVHDLGNPPFGHFGEEAIKNFFKNYFVKNANEGLTENLTELEKADFTNFDGDVQTFRILSKLYYFGDEYGYNLSYPCLASIIKYPVNSLEGNKKDAAEISKHKFGYFVSEQKRYDVINGALGLDHKRFPIVYLLEAADDIAYSAADIEDGVKEGIISIQDVREIFNQCLVENKEQVIKYLDEQIEKYKDQATIDQALIVQKFRIKCQQIMIEGVIDSFLSDEYYEKIMNGDLNEELIMISSGADVRRAYKQLQYKIFNSKGIQIKELGGWQSITGLLNIYVPACESDNFKSDGNTIEGRLYRIMSSSHRKVYEKIEDYSNSSYNRLHLIVDFIAGMTDRYAVNLYQELKGIKL